MNLHGPYCYTLFLSGETASRSIERKEFKGKSSNFRSPVTKEELEKIYIILHDQEIVYIGHTSQPIGNRLREALKASGTENSYKGYGWKHLQQVDLAVFVLDQTGNPKEEKRFAEAIEAELSFEVRKHTGSWPRFQTGIHFNNENRTMVRSLVQKIYDIVQ
ncbi:MAG: hypothetical protein HEP71_03215 [Roseivirga sp.]|nr:hypothetical protein [Roseivirga sp.]